MSDEESFVILGSSPTPSMEAYNSLSDWPKGARKRAVEKTQEDETKRKENSIENNPKSISELHYSIFNQSPEGKSPETTLIAVTESVKNIEIKENETKSISETTNNTILNHPNEAKSSKCDEISKSPFKYDEVKNKSFDNVPVKLEDSVDGENFSVLNTPKKSFNSLNTSGKQNKLEIDGNQEMASIELRKKTESVGPSSINSINGSKYGSLAASFILGDIQGDVLKASVYSQFPSICANTTSTEDIVKLQSFMNEYGQLKENLSKTNLVMKQTFSVLQKWQNENELYKVEQSKKMQDCHELIAKLRNENIELKKELETKLDNINETEKLMRVENEELVKALSEKSAMINNMRVQVEKLEQHQLSSFEYIKKNDKNDDNTEYILMSEHLRIFKEMERKLSEITAQNMELQDMKKIYIDEIDCLKVNSTCAEELLLKAQADINILKSKDIEKGDLFDSYEKEKNEMKQEIELLKTQLEIYRKDFEIERDARTNLAGEKEQLLSDIKMLQRRNQQLIEETQLKLSQSTKASISSKKSEPDDPIAMKSNFVCPLCGSSFTKLDKLEKHVQTCLDSGF